MLSWQPLQALGFGMLDLSQDCHRRARCSFSLPDATPGAPAGLLGAPAPSPARGTVTDHTSWVWGGQCFSQSRSFSEDSRPGRCGR